MCFLKQAYRELRADTPHTDNSRTGQGKPHQYMVKGNAVVGRQQSLDSRRSRETFDVTLVEVHACFWRKTTWNSSWLIFAVVTGLRVYCTVWPWLLYQVFSVVMVSDEIVWKAGLPIFSSRVDCCALGFFLFCLIRLDAYGCRPPSPCRAWRLGDTGRPVQKDTRLRPSLRIPLLEPEQGEYRCLVPSPCIARKCLCSVYTALSQGSFVELDCITFSIKKVASDNFVTNSTMGFRKSLRKRYFVARFKLLVLVRCVRDSVTSTALLFFVFFTIGVFFGRVRPDVFCSNSDRTVVLCLVHL